MTGEIPDMGGLVLQTVFALLVVVLAIWAAAWLMRRLHTPSRQGSLRVVAQVAFGMRERAVLLQVGDRQVLVGVAPGRVTPLLELDEPVTGTEMETAATFQNLLKRLRK